jgi:hypothetical protein
VGDLNDLLWFSRSKWISLWIVVHLQDLGRYIWPKQLNQNLDMEEEIVHVSSINCNNVLGSVGKVRTWAIIITKFTRI